MADLLWTGFQFVLLAVAGLFLLVCVIASWSSDENLPVRMIGFLVGSRWFKTKQAEQADAISFVRRLMDASVPRIAIENPISVISSKIRKPDQIIQPWQFGHGETKATCLWLKNLPKLKPTNIVEGRHARVHREPPGPNRWKNRSRTYQGIADAMAQQWCSL